MNIVAVIGFAIMVYLDRKYPDSYPMFPALFLGLVLTGW